MSTTIEQLLSQKIGMDINSIGKLSFQRVLAQQLQKFDCTIDQYSILVQQSDAVWISLVEAMVVPETWFFRYPESFILFEDLVKRRLEHAFTPSKLQILCLPCSSGEEPYSLAMTLLKIGLHAEQFCIDAIDINSQVLAQAQTGLFTQYSFRSNNMPDIQQFFEPVASCYRLKAEVIACVNLQLGNVFAPATLPLKTYDFIFCRNLLIYFDKEKQNIAVNQLHKLLATDGFLFSGPAEVGAFVRAGLTQLERRDCFAFANSPKKIPVKTQIKPNSQRSAFTLSKEKLPAIKNGLAGLQKSIVKMPTAPAQALRGRVATRAVVASTHEELINQIEQLSNAGQRHEALDLCQRVLKEFGPSAQLFYLWGLLFDSLDQQSNAEIYYRKVLYLQPLHPAALRQLAALLRSEGHTAAAALLEQRIKIDRT